MIIKDSYFFDHGTTIEIEAQGCPEGSNLALTALQASKEIEASVIFPKDGNPVLRIFIPRKKNRAYDSNQISIRKSRGR